MRRCNLKIRFWAGAELEDSGISQLLPYTSACQEVDEHKCKAGALLALEGIPSEGCYSTAKCCLNAVLSIHYLHITNASASVGCPGCHCH